MPAKPTKLSYFSVMMYMLTGKRAYRGNETSPAGFLELITIGRKSGKERRVDLIYIRDGSDYVIIASNGGKQRNPGWVFNARSNPHATIRVQDTQRDVVAEIAGPEKRKELWARLLEIAPMYAGYEKHTQREIPMVLLHPVTETPAS